MQEDWSGILNIACRFYENWHETNISNEYPRNIQWNDPKILSFQRQNEYQINELSSGLSATLGPLDYQKVSDTFSLKFKIMPTSITSTISQFELSTILELGNFPACSKIPDSKVNTRELESKKSGFRPDAQDFGTFQVLSRTLSTSATCMAQHSNTFKTYISTTTHPLSHLPPFSFREMQARACTGGGWILPWSIRTHFFFGLTYEPFSFLQS